MRGNSLWRVLGSTKRGSSRSYKGTRSKKNGKDFWTGVADTVIFRPYKPGSSLPLWREIYRSRRIIRRIERRQNQASPPYRNWLGGLVGNATGAWADLIVETKALLAALALHLVTLILIAAANLAWFAFLFWLIWAWLG